MAHPDVTLRARTDADLDTLYELAAELETWEERGPLPPAPLTRAAWEARRARREEADDGSVQFVVEVDGEAVGDVSLFEIDTLARHAEVGIALVSSARGRGIGTEALRQLAAFAFERHNLRRLHLEVISSNTGAIRSYEKVGFVVEGREREHVWIRGHYEDSVRMGLLRSEFSQS